MKKQNYFAPAIEVVEMVVENGIAASVQSTGFSLSDSDVENVDW